MDFMDKEKESKETLFWQSFVLPLRNFMEIISDYLVDGALRRSFNALAGEVFGLDFEPWYQGGWSGKYCPYSVVAGGQVVSNVSLNRIDCLLDGQPRHYVQLGTVMTGPEYRGRGYCRRLMERVLADCRDCDGVFLYANDSVLDFYPKFGFQPSREYRYRRTLAGAARAAVARVSGGGRDLPLEAGQGLLRLDTEGLLMFYLGGPMAENVYYHPASTAYVVAELVHGLLTVYGVFCRQEVDLADLCRAFGPGVERVELAFTPADRAGWEEYEHREEDTTLFLRGRPLVEDLEIFRGFPELAHA